MTHLTTDIGGKGSGKVNMPEILGMKPASGMVGFGRSCWVTKNLHFSIFCLFFSILDFSLASSFFVVAKELQGHTNLLSNPREQRNHLFLNKFSKSYREISVFWLGSQSSLNQSCGQWMHILIG